MIKLDIKYSEELGKCVSIRFDKDVDKMDIKELREMFRYFEDMSIQKIIFERGVNYGK